MRRVYLAVFVALAVLGVLGVAALASGRSPDAGGRQTVSAPIDKVDVVIRESNPPQVTVKISAGLPSGCAKQDSHSVSRAGDAITISVLNSVPNTDLVCTAIYGTYELNVDLGSNFAIGTTYTVRVNDKVTTFKT
jgi:hypothetical protein